jgi:hypothetical protein
MKKTKLLAFLLVPIVASGLLVINVASAQTGDTETDNRPATSTSMTRYNRNYNRNGTATSTGYKMVLRKNRLKNKLQNPIIKGNGQPVVGGTVASVSGSSLTITNASNVTYSIDASGAIISKKNATSTVSDINVGDRVMVQGSVSGTTITASSIIDRGVMPAATNPADTSGENGNGGFFGRIRGFFHNMFGFF